MHLTPFLDENNVLRVGGRLEHAFISRDEKHPIILPRLVIPDNANKEEWKTCPLTKKIIQFFHEECLHGGVEKTWSAIRARFHIPNGKNAVKYLIFRCLKCRILKAKETKQRMGMLPKLCLQPAPVFYHVTLDYAGPIRVQQSIRRRSKRLDPDTGNAIMTEKDKGWIAVWVCRVSGCYHIELIPNLTAEACIEGFKRFVAARSLPRTIRSDNASTFTKANKTLMGEAKKSHELAVRAIFDAEREIKEMYAFKGMEFQTSEELSWKFNPPLSPEFGGKHEAAVKQVKIHLKKAVGLALLPFHSLQTVLKQIEFAINSRPLCRVEGPSYERQQILTPAHLWLGRTLIAWPEPNVLEENNFATRYIQVQRSFQYF